MNNIKNFVLIALLLTTGLTSCSSQLPSNKPSKKEVLQEVLNYTLANLHYTPQVLNDTFSKKLYTLYIERLDPFKRYLLKSDLEALNEFKYELDDAVKNNDFTFFEQSLNIYTKRTAQVERIYKTYLKESISFDDMGQIETNPEKRNYPKDSIALQAYWHKLLKFQVLDRIHDDVIAQEQRKADDTTKIKSFEALELKHRKQVLKMYTEWSDQEKQEEEIDRFAVYMNALTNVFGPHTNYFPPIQKDNFDIRMSGKLEGIGAQLTYADGYTTVASIVPGSASDLQGELKAKDKIVKVAQEGKDAVDIVGMRLNNVLPLIRGKKGSKVILTVEKPDGTTANIPIIRDVVIMEESYAKSALLEHKKIKGTVGLIQLPSFYVDFNNPKGRRCFTDVKKEVEKLIREEVSGIVIDLRNNGGGSLLDVINMTGLFIDKGPVVQVKERNKQAISKKDYSTGTLYNGPIVLLVNSFSASASEIMAAALQDYGRAIIIGTSNSTFGKGTVQRFVDLDQIVNTNFLDENGLGSLKLTIQKFYRINGQSTQLKGVTPDILLPNPFSYIKVGEQEEKYVMPWDEVPPSVYQKYKPSYNLSEIKSNSAQRVKNNKTFQLLDENAKWVKKQRESTLYPLSFKAYKAREAKIKEEAKKYENIFQKMDNLSISPTSMDKIKHIEDEKKAKRFKEWEDKLLKDKYLEEALFIISEM